MLIALNVARYLLAISSFLFLFLVWTASPVNRWQYIASVEML